MRDQMPTLAEDAKTTLLDYLALLTHLGEAMVLEMR
jgi:hypothetical protein